MEFLKKPLSNYLIQQTIWDKSEVPFSRRGKFHPSNLSQISSIRKIFLDKYEKINLVKVQKFVQHHFGLIW